LKWVAGFRGDSESANSRNPARGRRKWEGTRWGFYSGAVLARRVAKWEGLWRGWLWHPPNRKARVERVRRQNGIWGVCSGRLHASKWVNLETPVLYPGLLRLLLGAIPWCTKKFTDAERLSLAYLLGRPHDKAPKLTVSSGLETWRPAVPP
jgi:hypothetical protein